MCCSVPASSVLKTSTRSVSGLTWLTTNVYPSPMPKLM
jgi:hypothetical protein